MDWRGARGSGEGGGSAIGGVGGMDMGQHWQQDAHTGGAGQEEEEEWVNNGSKTHLLATEEWINSSSHLPSAMAPMSLCSNNRMY